MIHLKAIFSRRLFRRGGRGEAARVRAQLTLGLGFGSFDHSLHRPAEPQGTRACPESEFAPHIFKFRKPKLMLPGFGIMSELRTKQGGSGQARRGFFFFPKKPRRSVLGRGSMEDSSRSKGRVRRLRTTALNEFSHNPTNRFSVIGYRPVSTRSGLS